MSGGYRDIVYSHEVDSPWPWGQPRMLHLHDENNACLLDTLVTAEVIMDDGRGSFYYLTSDLLNPNVHTAYKTFGSHFHRLNLSKFGGGTGSCVQVGSFGEQRGASWNNNFILVKINRDQYSADLKKHAISFDNLRQNLQVPPQGRERVYSVQTRRTNLYLKRTGHPRTDSHYIKRGPRELMVMEFTEGIGRSREALQPEAGVIRETLGVGDAGRLVYMQDTAQFESKALIPRPGQAGCVIVGHVACIKDRPWDNTQGEVLVQPLTRTIEGLAELFCEGSGLG